MKTHHYIIMLAVILLTGCMNTRPATPVYYSYPTPDQKNELTQLVFSSLKDPESAQFGDVILIDHGKGACVAVNAKNTYGGYTGLQQAMLMNMDNIGWQLLDIRSVTLEVCGTALHSVITSN